jgi:glycerophosphoryl diester phosphodiesterase
MRRWFSSLFSRLLPWVVLLHSLTFMAFWLTNSLFYASTNDYLADMLGQRLDYVSLLIWVSAFVAAWSILRVITLFLKKTYPLKGLFAWVYGILSLIYIVFFYGSFNLLFSESPVQLVRIKQMLHYFRLFVDVGLLLGVALLAAILLRNYLRKRPVGATRQAWRLVILALVVFAVLWSMALIYPPGSVVRGLIADKPLIIAHRGASMLAPENTMAAAYLADEIGVYGLETDVHISRDGEVFLLHDDTFDRTTDVASIFPGREKEPAENFSMAEIRQLNAGKWFMEQDPFNAYDKGLLSADQVDVYQQQVVPMLADYLEFVRAEHLAFRFDLKPLPEDHPFADAYFEIVLNQVHQAGIDAQVWFLVDSEQLKAIRDLAPGMLAAYSANYKSLVLPEQLTAQGYQVVNVEYGIDPAWIQAYRQADLWVDVYTVDEPWQFSRLWLLGVNSITTSNAGVMAELARPILSVAYSAYVVIWSLVGLVGAGLIVGLLFPVIKQQPTNQPSDTMV